MLVIEKLSATGGTSALSGGGIDAPGSVLQKEAGIEDSPEAYVEQWMYYQSLTHREGMENPDEERCLFLARQGAGLIDRLMSYGYEFGIPIPNLYAAGAISNGALYDTAYMSGSSVLNCYVMGRIAGANAAALAD